MDGGWRVSQCFTFSQTNRLSDVIVFRDVPCVGGDGGL